MIKEKVALFPLSLYYIYIFHTLQLYHYYMGQNLLDNYIRSLIRSIVSLSYTIKYQEGNSISRQNLNEDIETIPLTPTQFYHLHGFYPKTGFLRNHLLSLIKCMIFLKRTVNAKTTGIALFTAHIKLRL